MEEAKFDRAAMGRLAKAFYSKQVISRGYSLGFDGLSQPLQRGFPLIWTSWRWAYATYGIVIARDY